MSDKIKTITVDYLARVEGEGALYVKMEGSTVKQVHFKIFEPPRFFEAFLKGRKFTEAPDLTARICGICPVAYQMSAVNAMENALDVKMPEPLLLLRRLLYCGEWIESHALHIHMLHAPDFLGFPDAIAMAKKHKGVVERGLAIKKAGNAIGQLLGGREVHPINVRVGGFYKIPAKKDFLLLLEQLKRARDLAVESVEWLRTLPMPDFSRDYFFVALQDLEYPFASGKIATSEGLAITPAYYEKFFAEEQVEHSNALHSRFKDGRAYAVGPLARYHLNYSSLSALAKDAAQRMGLGKSVKNPFQSILVSAVEVIYALDEAVRILENYREPEKAYLPVEPKAAHGFGATEAPRGLLYHHYEIDETGIIKFAKIVPPTSQNQATIEADLVELLPRNLHLSDEQLQWKCEQAIRNYDPCISCATHFLNFQLERG